MCARGQDVQVICLPVSEQRLRERVQIRLAAERRADLVAGRLLDAAVCEQAERYSEEDARVVHGGRDPIGDEVPCKVFDDAR